MRHAIRWGTVGIAVLLAGWGGFAVLSRDAGQTAPVERARGATEDRTPLATSAGELRREFAVGDAPDAGAEPAPSTALEEEVPRAALIVHVRSSAGVPLHGSFVKVEASASGGVPEKAPHVDDGRFVLEDLPPGAWTVRASAPLHAVAQREVTLAAHGEPVEIELVLAAERRFVRIVLVTPQDEPFFEHDDGGSDLAAFATREQPERFLSEVATKQTLQTCGRFYSRRELGLDERTLGLLQPRCDAPLLVHLALGLDVLATEVLGPDVEELVFALDPVWLASLRATLAFAIVDERTGAPLAASHLIHTSGAWVDDVLFGRDSEGRFELATVPGPATLVLGAYGYEELRREVLLERGERRDLGPIGLRSLALGELVVVVNCPLDLGVLVIAEAVDGSAHDGPGRTFELYLDGAQATLPLPLGRYVLTCYAGTGSERFGCARQTVDVVAEPQRVTLDLVPLPLVELRAPERRAIILRDEHGLFVDSGDVGPEPLGIELAPGRYQVVARDRANTERTVEFDVTELGARVDLP